jgi:hypothetical protein
MGRTGKGGFRQTKQKTAPGALIRKATVTARPVIAVEFEKPLTKKELRQAFQPGWVAYNPLLIDESPRAGLLRYLGVNRAEA